MANDSISIINLPNALVSEQTEETQQDEGNQLAPVDINPQLTETIFVARKNDLPSNDDQNVECLKAEENEQATTNCHKGKYITFFMVYSIQHLLFTYRFL